jgi:hypothetical protein
MNTEQEHLKKINSELQLIEFGEKDKLASHLRKTEVYLKKVFGKDSEYYERFCRLSFVPEGVIYNTGHYKNKEIWENGISNYSSLLETVGYEFELKNLKGKNELEYQSQVTLHWLKAHIPIKIWISFISLLIAAFIAGVTASEYKITKFFITYKKPLVQNIEK